MNYRVLCDENVEARTVGELERRGITATHVDDHPGKGSSDEAVADWARENGYVVLTNDTDFLVPEAYPNLTVLYYSDPRVSAHEIAKRVEELTTFVPDPGDLPKETFLNE